MVELAKFRSSTQKLKEAPGKIFRGLRGAASDVIERTGAASAIPVAAAAADPTGTALRNPRAFAEAVAAPFKASMEAQTAQRTSNLRPRIYSQGGGGATMEEPPMAVSHAAPRTATTLRRPPGPVDAPVTSDDSGAVFIQPTGGVGNIPPAPAPAPAQAVGLRSYEDVGGAPRTVQRPVMDYRQVRDPVTGLDDPQLVDTGQTKTMYIGKDGREYESATLASAADKALAETGKITAEAGEVAANAAALRAYHTAQAEEAEARTTKAGKAEKAPVVKTVQVATGKTTVDGTPIQETLLSIATPGQEPQVVRPRDLFTPTQAQRELTRLYGNLSDAEQEQLNMKMEGRDDLDVWAALDAVYDAGALRGKL